MYFFLLSHDVTSHDQISEILTCTVFYKGSCRIKLKILQLTTQFKTPADIFDLQGSSKDP